MTRIRPPVAVLLLLACSAFPRLTTARPYHELARQRMEDTYPRVAVNPPDRLREAVVLGAWDEGAAVGWETAAGTEASVRGTVLRLQGDGGTDAPALWVSGLADGPDLDFGFFNHVQVRLAVQEGHRADIAVYYGTSTRGGFSPERRFTIPAEKLITDGAMHTYRIDVGLEVFWRDRLTDLGIGWAGAAGAGQRLALEYVEVGDLPGDVLRLNTQLNMPPAVEGRARHTLDELQKLESKHFVVWWTPETEKEVSRDGMLARARRSLRMLEESYQVYRKVLGFEEPFEHTDPEKRDGHRYKLNQSTWHGGFWMGGGDFTYFNVGPGGLQDEGWGNPVPHEYAHAVQGAQPGFLVGGHWESHANYLRDERLAHYADVLTDEHNRSTIDLRILELSNFRQDHQRIIYADYRIHRALEQAVVDYELDPLLPARLWAIPPKNQSIYEKFEPLLPPSVSLKEVIGISMRHWPFLDLSRREEMRARLWRTAEQRAFFDYAIGSPLIPAADGSGWHRVPFERAPERFAFMSHELRPEAETVTVELRGVTLIDDAADWRWSLAAVNTDGEIRYSELWAPGEQRFRLQPGEDRLVLVVVATPGEASLDLGSQHNTKPADKHPDRLRYPYLVRLEGAAAVPAALHSPREGGAPHANGGGWVASSARVEDTAYVGPEARVLGRAQVLGRARVEDYATVTDQARLEGEAMVSGYALVRGQAQVRDRAVVRDRAILEGQTVVQDDAAVEHFARTFDQTRVRDRAIVRGCAMPFGRNELSGTAIADYDYSMDFTYDDGVHFGHVPWGGWFREHFGTSLVKPRGLVASYRMEEPAGEVVWDEFGARHALAMGRPDRVMDPSFSSRVLRLNGSDQYLWLDRGLADFREGTFALWARPAGTGEPQPLLYFSGAGDRTLRIERTADGHARAVLHRGDQRGEWRSEARLPDGTWSHVALRIADGQGTLYINGQPAAEGAAPVTPRDVLGPNDYRHPEAAYAGRDADRFFRGDLTELRFYNNGLDEAEIRHEIRRSGVVLGLFLLDEPHPFSGGDGAVHMETGVRNGLERTLAAWIRPRASARTDYYEPVFDANDEREGRHHGSGLGLRDGEIVVRLDGRGFWRTGVNATLGEWQHVGLSFDGRKAVLYVNGEEKAATDYEADALQLAGKNYRLGWGQHGQQDNTRTYFDGEIFGAAIAGRALKPDMHAFPPPQ